MSFDVTSTKGDEPSYVWGGVFSSYLKRVYEESFRLSDLRHHLEDSKSLCRGGFFYPASKHGHRALSKANKLRSRLGLKEGIVAQESVCRGICLRVYGIG